MSQIVCNFCKKTFKTKYTLKNHQNTAKFCLLKQDKKIDTEHKCEFCKRQFSRLYHLNRHQKKCRLADVCCETLNNMDKVKEENSNLKRDVKQYTEKIEYLEAEMLDLKQDHKREIQILQDKLENVAIQAARRPTQSNTYNRNVNTLIQNMSPLTEENLKDNSQHLTIEHLKRGVKGYVEYAVNYPLKDKVLCVDYARRKIKYKDDDGKVQTDPEMTRLSRKFFESIQDKNRKLAYECVQQLSDDMDACEKMKIMADMGQLMVDVNQSASGSKTDFTHDFVRGVCSESVR